MNEKSSQSTRIMPVDCNLQQAFTISAYQKSLDMKEVLFCEFTPEKFYTQYMEPWKNVDRLFCIVEDWISDAMVKASAFTIDAQGSILNARQFGPRINSVFR